MLYICLWHVCEARKDKDWNIDLSFDFGYVHIYFAALLRSVLLRMLRTVLFLFCFWFSSFSFSRGNNMRIYYIFGIEWWVVLSSSLCFSFLLLLLLSWRYAQNGTWPNIYIYRYVWWVWISINAIIHLRCDFAVIDLHCLCRWLSGRTGHTQKKNNKWALGVWCDSIFIFMEIHRLGLPQNSANRRPTHVGMTCFVSLFYVFEFSNYAFHTK